MAEEHLEGTVVTIDYQNEALTIVLKDQQERVLRFDPTNMHTYMGLVDQSISCTVDGDLITKLLD